MGPLESLNDYQRYPIENASEIEKIEMNVYSHVVLHSAGEGTTVGYAMLEGVPTVDTAIFGDDFEHRTHGLSGSMELVLRSATEYLVRFDSGFSTGNGPGLYVYLIQTGLKPTASDIELGPLKSLSGAQEYPVPAGLNIFPFAYALVHCKPANVHFGRAPLNTLP